ncbi:sulfatase-like hydrolase/transferase [Clostridium sp.]
MKRPNILIFMTDQQRGDSIFPYSKAKTPNINKFCGQGVTFSNAYTVSPHCCPSRATFFSGLYPSQHGVWNNVNVGNTLSRGLYKGVRLFSEDLKDNGYGTYFSGRWHVSNVESPLDRGFEVMDYPKPFEKKELVHEAPSAKEWERFENYQPQGIKNEAEILRRGYDTYVHYGLGEKNANDRNVVEDALKIIHSREKSDKPWCHYIGTCGPHDPYFVPQEYLDMYDINDIKLPDNFTDLMKDKPALYRRTRDRFDQLTPEEHKEAIRHYLAFCTYEDDLFGKVLEALEESGEAQNTLVLYLSDHGDYMAEHGLWCKGLPCFKGAYHIPAVIRWPEGVKNPGRVVDEFVSLADFAPTFLEVAGVEYNRTMTGNSLVSYIHDEKPSVIRDAIFTQSNGNEIYGIQRSVMTKDWKFVYNGFDYDELYNLNKDPGETTNIMEGHKDDEIVKELSIKLWDFARKVGDVCVNPYIMVGLASYGPGILYEKENEKKE